MTRKPKTIEAPVNVVAPGEGAAEVAPEAAPAEATVHTEVPPPVAAAKFVAEQAAVATAERAPTSRRRKQRRGPFMVRGDIHWAVRRRFAIYGLALSTSLSVYALWKDSGDGELANAVLPSAMFLAASILGAYIGFAAYERSSGVPDGNQQYTDVDIDVDVRRGE